MTGRKNLLRRLRTGIAVILLIGGPAASAEALTIVFTGSDANGRSAFAKFSQAGTGQNVVITLANTSGSDVDGASAREFILTGLFFNLGGQSTTFGRVNANLANQYNSSNSKTTTLSFAYSCSTKSAGPCTSSEPTSSSGTNIGPEWGYLFNSAGLSKTYTQKNVISSDNYGIGLDSTTRFDTTQNYSGTDSPDGLEYGLTSFGDNTVTSTDLVSTSLIKSAGIFSLSVTAGFTLASVTDVVFHYGPLAADPNVAGIESIPIPGTLLLVSSGLLAVGSLLELGRRRKQKAALQD